LNPENIFQPAKIQPTGEQLAVQTTQLRTLLIQANAGAAKTTTLALRAAQALHCGLAPEGILALTYTQPACEAMEEALRKIGVAPSLLRRLSRHSITTFDAFAERTLLSVEKRRVAVKKTHEDVAPFVRQAIGQLGLPTDSLFIEQFLNVSRRLKGTMALDHARWEGRKVSAALAEELGIDLAFLRLHTSYEDLRFPQRDGVDSARFRWQFDPTYDLARMLGDPEPSTLLDEIPAWPRRLALLLVDEMHDLNAAMHTVLKALVTSNDAAAFCGVGDSDQVIHEASGAEQRFMSPDLDLGPRRVSVLPLTASHRFNRTLASTAGRVAGKPYASMARHGTRVRCNSYPGPDGRSAEQIVVDAVNEWKTATGGDLQSLAILLRHPCQSVAVESALLRHGIAYATRGLTSFVLQPEVLLIRALLAVATGNYQHLAAKETQEALVRAVVFFCGIELGHELSESESREERLQNAIRHVTAQQESLKPFMEYQVLQRAEPALARRMRAAIAVAGERNSSEDWFARFLDALDVRAWVRQVFISQQRREDALAYFDGLKRAAMEFRGPEAFFDCLGRYESRLQQTASALKNAVRAGLARKATLTLATIHDVKGLEFGHVVMPYLEQGTFPARLALSAREERNLFYVGITRAREALTLVASAQRPSAFLQAAGLTSA
jgi:DNA helicase-2/ATP-dependent DNA helicase PcrA